MATKAEKIAKIPIEEVAKLSGETGKKQLEKYVSTMRSSYRRRVQSFRHNNQVSHAQISLERSLVARPVPLKNMSRNQLILEFVRYSKFFNSETSSLSGIRKVNRIQDARIFGVNKRGKPLATMTSEQRERYWNLYEEFLNQKPLLSAPSYSSHVQQSIAEALFNDKISPDNLVKFLDYVESKIKKTIASENMEDIPNVHSGRGDARI